ncbi:MAG: phosphoglycerate kinase, partial [Candidatus Bathyarchaeia archaeon]
DNVRNFAGETKEGPPEEHAKSELVQALAPLASIFVNDAFAAAHLRMLESFSGLMKDLRGKFTLTLKMPASSLKKWLMRCFLISTSVLMVTLL